MRHHGKNSPRWAGDNTMIITTPTTDARVSSGTFQVVRPASASTDTSNKTLNELNAKMDAAPAAYRRATSANTRRLTGKPNL
jgi:hypothetical protein